MDICMLESKYRTQHAAVLSDKAGEPTIKIKVITLDDTPYSCVKAGQPSEIKGLRTHRPRDKA